jgi:translation initiation factor IF-1
MPPDAAIHAHGEVIEPAGPVLYRVSLPNRKTILAHLSKPLADAGAHFAAGDTLLLELTPYDFDTARILCAADSGKSLADAEAAEDHA